MSEDWIEALRMECDRTSQAQVARRLKVSGAQINQVLHGVYKAVPRQLEALVRGEILGETVACPVVGRLKVHLCLEQQRRPFEPTNSLRVRFYKACRAGCPQYQEER